MSLDISKAVSLLNWNPKLSIDEEMQLIVDWYKESVKSDTYGICLRQIDEYEKK